MGIGAHGDDGVAEDAEIGAGTEAFYGVSGVWFSGIEVGEKSGGEMAAGAGAHDADAFGIDLPSFGLRAG